jgi:hypothetical protein
VSGPSVFPEHVQLVLDALGGTDARHPVTKAWLAMRTGLSSRGVEATIEHIRRESIGLVASSSAQPAGYWWPATFAEAEENVERRHSRAIHQIETCQGERKLIARMREAENPRPSLWEMASRTEGPHVARADAPSPLRAEGAPSEGARLG